MIPERFEFLFFMCIFTLPPIILLWILNFNYLKKNLKIIFSIMAVAVLYQLFADPFAMKMNAWHFPKQKTLGLWIYNFPVEDTIFVIIIAAAISSAVLVFLKHKKVCIKL